MSSLSSHFTNPSDSDYHDFLEGRPAYKPTSPAYSPTSPAYHPDSPPTLSTLGKRSSREEEEEEDNVSDGKNEERDLECGFCLEPKNDPRMLTCLHSACLACLNSLYGKKKALYIECPSCASLISVANVNDLPVDRFFYQQKELFSLRKKQKTSPSSFSSFSSSSSSSSSRHSDEKLLGLWVLYGGDMLSAPRMMEVTANTAQALDYLTEIVKHNLEDDILFVAYAEKDPKTPFKKIPGEVLYPSDLFKCNDCSKITEAEKCCCCEERACVSCGFAGFEAYVKNKKGYLVRVRENLDMYLCSECKTCKTMLNGNINGTVVTID